MDTRNFTFLCYGLMAAWLILCGYVATLAGRERRLKREVERLRTLVEDRERTG
jgi:CcmD family protein